MVNNNWNPWMNPEDLREEEDQLLDQALRGTGGRRRRECGYLWKPAADVYETERGYVIQVELPGFAVEDIAIETREDSLWIYGERKFERDAEAGSYLSLERCYGPFARQFTLPPDVDRAGIAAKYKSGLLTLAIPKAPKLENKRIRIEVTG